MADVVEMRARDALVREVLERAGGRVFADWEDQLRRSGFCFSPVRLRVTIDRVDADSRSRTRVYDSGQEPDGVLLKACGNRRASVCPPCSATYQRDAYQLVAAGLRGGKGVPATVAEHPMVFATFTAPGFGVVHTEHADKQRRCRARRGKCPHGRPLGCWRRHRPDDDCLGEPLCPECFDYDGQAVWNAGASELWRRTTIYIKRSLARVVGVSQAELHRSVRLSYVKVAEYQRRGALHFHVVVRVDGRADDGAYLPPGLSFAGDRLSEAIRGAAGAVSAPGLAGASIRWGEELAVEPIAAETARVARYIAKYTTKSADDLDPDSEHLRRCAEAARRVCSRSGLPARKLQRAVGGLGFCGHWTTKSRRYSTTLGALRQARIDHAREREQRAALVQADSEPGIEIEWRYSGRGHARAGDRWLAESAYRAKRQAAAEAWMETRRNGRTVE